MCQRSIIPRRSTVDLHAEFKNCRVVRESGVRSQESGGRMQNILAKNLTKNLVCLVNF
ncbi:hypothetical protein V0288_17795 [Pannus brasiliensis CCIBt3594]|uniref:Uncharacterized protein n=1 Tax=Pannus brasiliensis CCIBt3594 TaxID=1427578 RepID=A0AAW9QYZ9_9CHRO